MRIRTLFLVACALGGRAAVGDEEIEIRNWAAPPYWSPQVFSFAARVEALRDIERARYAFTLEAARPFDEVYPRAVFERLARRQRDQERVLKTRFALEVPHDLLEKELERVERSTRAPDQWEAVKKALGNDREKILRVFCRPLVVEKALRRAFAFDQGIHAEQHQRARAARNAFLLGKPPAASMKLKLARLAEGALSADELLQRAKSEASTSRVTAPPKTDGTPQAETGDRPLAVAAEMQPVLERELKSPRDVTTILEEANQFSVFRLVASDGSSWSVIGVRILKRDFDSWFEEARRER